MAIIIGLTGGIASGKTFVSNYLKKLNYSVHESDIVVSKLYEKPKVKFISFLKKNGFENAIKKNKINKKIIRDEIFNFYQKKIKIEKYIHNEIKKNRKIFLKKNKNKKIVILDIPLLFEKKLEKECNFTCSTIATLKNRKQRALKRQHMNAILFSKIVKNQTTDKARKQKSNYLINTNLSKIKTCLQVEDMIYDILKKGKK